MQRLERYNCTCPKHTPTNGTPHPFTIKTHTQTPVQGVQFAQQDPLMRNGDLQKQYSHKLSIILFVFFL